MIAPSSLRDAEISADDCFSGGQNDPPMTENERLSLLQMDVPYVEQTAGREQGEMATLPVKTIEDFLKQEDFIINALAPAAKGSDL